MSVVFKAQAQGQADVVTLKNGSVIKGFIVEQVPNQSIKIQTRDGNIFVYSMDEVAKLSKEVSSRQSYRQRNVFTPSKYNNSKDRGYYGVAEFGYGFGVDDYKLDRISVGIVNGYKLDYYFAVGLGIGLNYYKEYFGNIPVYAHFRTVQDFV